MDKRLLDHDPFTGITTYHHYDEATDETTIQEVADLDPINKFRYELRKDESITKKGIKNGQWLYASIHPLEQQKWMRKYGFSPFEKGREKEVMKILNTDPEFALCKNTSGTHA